MMTIALLGLSGAFAQDAANRAEVPDLDAQRFRPSLDASESGLWLTDVAGVPEPGAVAQIGLSYHDDLVVYLSEGEEVGIVRNLLQANVAAAWGVGPLRVGVDLPLVLRAVGDLTGGETGLGDVALDGRVAVAGPKAPIPFPVALGVRARLTAPTATVNTSLGARTTTWSLGVVGSLDVGPVQVAANLGTRGGPAVDLENVTVNDAFDWRAGASWGLSERVSVSAEVVGLISYAEPLANAASHPTEGLLGVQTRLSDTLVFQGGLGRGLTPGIGAPEVRLATGLAWRRAPQGADQ